MRDRPALSSNKILKKEKQTNKQKTQKPASGILDTPKELISICLTLKEIKNQILWFHVTTN